MASTNIISSGIASDLDAVNALTPSEKQAIIRPNNPPAGIAGFVADIVEDEEINLRSEITDHFVEDNTTFQDQIGLLPTEITVRFIVAELAARIITAPTPAPIPDALPDNPAFAPVVTESTTQSQRLIIQSTQGQTDSVTGGESLYNYFSNTSTQFPNETRQTKSFLYFKALRDARELFTVETFSGIFQNCAIVSLRAMQPKETRFMTEFAITFKQIRIAQDVTINLGQLAGRAQAQQAPVTNNGNAGTGNTQNASLLYQGAKAAGIIK